jgi:hypothetical protein
MEHSTSAAHDGQTLPESLQAKYWFTGILVFYAALSIAIILGNVLTLVAYWTTPSLQTPGNLLIFNLSLVDTVIPILSFHYTLLNYTQWGIIFNSQHKWSCLLCLWLVISITLNSILGILLISLERVIAVFLPFKYYDLVTERSVKVVIVCTWTLAFAVNAPPIMGWTTWTRGARCFALFVYPSAYISVMRTPLTGFLLLSIALMNIAIAIVAVKKSRVQPSEASEQHSNHYKVTKMLLLVVGLFYLTWMPNIITTTFYSLTQDTSDQFVILHDYCKMLLGVNSVLNPLIYANQNKLFRAAFIRLLKKLLRLKQANVSPDSTKFMLLWLAVLDIIISF